MATYNNVNLRVKYNTLGVLSCNARKNKRLRGYDIIDKSRQYRATITIANTYTKTEYVKYNGNIIKLDTMIKQLRRAHKQWYINSDRTYITIMIDNKPQSIKITYTNGVLVKHNTIDRKQYKKIYNK